MTTKEYLAKMFDGMAKGLFVSLIIGTIIKQIGTVIGVLQIQQIGSIAQYCMGPAIGAGVAFVRQPKMITFVAAIIAGAIGAGTFKFTNGAVTAVTGEPAGAFIASLVAVELGRLAEGHTKFDLIAIPFISITGGSLVGLFVSPVISNVLLKQIGVFVQWLSTMPDVPMGILVGIVVGMILTLPISSTAICVAINIGINASGTIPAGAALAGCCAQMVGFAVISWRDNKFGGLCVQAVGTSMVQIPNIIKNPLIWIPPTVASGVCGLLSTLGFKMVTTSVGAGMGTSGLVGQFATYGIMGINSLIPMILLHFLIPAAISITIAEFMRYKGWIKNGDLSI
ncbi:MAG: PTS sugar transporter subunit IIC [Clostridiales bacterium]|jgi:uncharacterized membrane protein|nr:PTS sugar transporter subunit IIC [Clostridiales bacterium]